ncbi:unconventional myosin-IXa [Galendromus occidentalis]|uniref:Unconventional myosin-IXa n=1 Tax=Galendromus occidentalis TaxID=34638 RepID=A0AAJ6QNW4_9ACAR|nr:unconventional myosin-IXa [Galendromus occidentalis]
MATKVFILEKYFTELQKYWDTEKRLHDASSQNEAVHLQQRLKSLSSELVTLRKRLSVAQPVDSFSVPPPPPPPPLDTKPATSTYENIGDIKPMAPSIRVDGTNEFAQSPPRTLVEVNDLIDTNGPLTEDSVLRTLHARFFQKQYFTNIGPVLLAANPYNEPRSDLTLTSIASVNNPELMKVVREAAIQQAESGLSQTIILSGESGSGKTYASMVLLRQLFDIAGGGPGTDCFKHLAAAFTVLRSFGTAKTLSNSQSSRIGYFIEVQATGGVLYHPKIHCLLLDQSRVVRQPKNEKNYHIFYQMLAGLSYEEKEQLGLEDCSVESFNYLNQADTQCDTQLDAERFRNWKSGVAVLGIPYLDIMKTLAAILLLGNINFVDKDGAVDIESGREIKKVAGLLKITPTALYSALTRRIRYVHRHPMSTVCTSAEASASRDALAKALYYRTVATVVRCANSLKGMNSMSGTLSSDSNESVHNQVEVNSQHASTAGSNSTKKHKSMTVLNSAVKHATDGFIGILDMFGFENALENRLEQLCINLCAETMQHFYNSHVFKSQLDACKNEGVNCDLQIEYSDSVPCLNLISGLRTGLFIMCDAECANGGTPETFVENISNQHRSNPSFLRPAGADASTFAIKHYAGNVTYNASSFLECNSDVIPGDVLCLFKKNSDYPDFVTSLFKTELDALYANGGNRKCTNFRISPLVSYDCNSDDPIPTLTQDFHIRMGELVQKLVKAKPQFIQCIKTNKEEQPSNFDRHCVMKQLRDLQVLETVNLMASGYAHRIKFSAFNRRYRLLAPFKSLERTELKAVLDCQLILEYFTEALKKVKLSNAAVNWSLGDNHIFLSENARQQLERFREQRRQTAARLIQGAFREFCRKKRRGLFRKPLPRIRTEAPKSQHPIASARTATLTKTGTLTKLQGRPRPQPISGTPPPENERCDQRLIQQTCALFGLDLEQPPPVPPSRRYTVTGNAKLGYPQARVMKMNFGDGSNAKLLKGDTVMVIASSQKRGHLVVEFRGQTCHVPYQFLELKPEILSPPPVNSLINTTLISN